MSLPGTSVAALGTNHRANNNSMELQQNHISTKTSAQVDHVFSNNGNSLQNPENVNASSSSPSSFSATTRLPTDSDTKSDLTSVNKEDSDLHLDKGKPSSLLEMGKEDEKNSNHLILKLDRNYTPNEIAEYIFSTGDEKGISQAVSDMIQDGQIMSSKDDVIRFLEAVQKELNQLRNQFHQKVQSDEKSGDIYHHRRSRTSSLKPY
ncbi:unnamed protein product [Orchesella dallaii]|uniref:Uncharacterized protein n=1 Tax=Orchesella dallaii TaxID=48710 RepID=A0ABP1S181_9HEXA